MSDKREYLIGAKFTADEKKIIDDYIRENDLSKSDFVREAIFSYLVNVKDQTVGLINYDQNKKYFNEIKNAVEIIIKNSNIISNHVNKIDKELFSYDLKRIQNALQYEARGKV